MGIENSNDLFTLHPGARIPKSELYDLIQYSKVEGSSQWLGEASSIGNTPQQGINWIGSAESPKGVIIKTSPGRYPQDGWIGSAGEYYRYSFKAIKGKVSLQHKPNQVLVQQPRLQYPVFLFIQDKGQWLFEGFYTVHTVEDSSVILNRVPILNAQESSPHGEPTGKSEGTRRYVTHIVAERNKSLVKAVKEAREWVCDICGTDFKTVYGTPYIEAHHKVPVSQLPEAHESRPEDFALLCPNCHTAVHIRMRQAEENYAESKEALRSRWYET